MTDSTALARLYLEYLDTVIAPRAFAGAPPPKAQDAATELAAWLTARGVRVLPSEPSAAAVDAAAIASGFVEEGESPDKLMVIGIAKMLRAAYAVDAAPRPEEPS